MIKNEQIQKGQLLDISKKNTDVIADQTRANLIVYGNLIFVDISCTINSKIKDKAILYANLPYTPSNFTTELNVVTDSGKAMRGYIGRGEIYVYSQGLNGGEDIFINGIFFI